MNIKKERKKEHHNPLVNTLTMRKSNKSILHFAFIPHLVIIISFAIISLLFYYPLLSGKVLFQSDIRQYEGMSRQLKNHRAQTGNETYWIDNAFGGMPTYQLGAKYPADFLNPIYSFFPNSSTSCAYTIYLFAWILFIDDGTKISMAN